MNHAAKYDEQKLSFGGDTMAKVAWKCEFLGKKKGCGLCYNGGSSRLERGNNKFAACGGNPSNVWVLSKTSPTEARVAKV